MKTIAAFLMLAIITAVPLASFAEDTTTDATSSPATGSTVDSTTTPALSQPQPAAPSTPASSDTTDQVLGGNPSLMNTDTSAPATSTAVTAATTTDDTASNDTSSNPPGAPTGGGPSPASSLGPVIPLRDGDVVYVFPSGNSDDTTSIPGPADSTAKPLPPLAPPVDIVWTTSVPATTRVFFSTSTSPIDLSSSFTPSVGDDTLSLHHAVVLPSLFVDTPYDIVYQSKNADGTIILSNFMSLNIKTATSTETATTTTSILSTPFNGAMTTNATPSSGNTLTTP